MLVFLEFGIGDVALGRTVIELFDRKETKAAERFYGLCNGHYGRKGGPPLCYLGCKVFEVARRAYLRCGDIHRNSGDGDGKTKGGAEEQFDDKLSANLARSSAFAAKGRAVEVERKKGPSPKGLADALDQLGEERGRAKAKDLEGQSEFASASSRTPHDHAGIVSLVPIGHGFEQPKRGRDGRKLTYFGTEFLITLGKCSALNGKCLAIGQVRSGMEVLRALERLPVDIEGRPELPVYILNCGDHQGVTKVATLGDRGRTSSDATAAEAGEALLKKVLAAKVRATDDDSQDDEGPGLGSGLRLGLEPKRVKQDEERSVHTDTMGRAIDLGSLSSHFDLHSTSKSDSGSGSDSDSESDSDLDSDTDSDTNTELNSGSASESKINTKSGHALEAQSGLNEPEGYEHDKLGKERELEEKVKHLRERLSSDIGANADATKFRSLPAKSRGREKYENDGEDDEDSRRVSKKSSSSRSFNPYEQGPASDGGPPGTIVYDVADPRVSFGEYAKDCAAMARAPTGSLSTNNGSFPSSGKKRRERSQSGGLLNYISEANREYNRKLARSAEKP